MRIAEILRGLADAIEQNDHDTAASPSVEKPSNEPDMQDMGKFSPPLQQKHELLKKVSGVDSEYDSDTESSPELAIIKKLAGIVHADDDLVG
jgi:hypothetical protein